MSESQPFDVRRAIEQSSSKSTLQELAKKGIHRVKVLDESMINKLIGDAVERIISTKTNLLSTDDRQKLIQASRAELDRLMKEHKETKDKAELMVKDKGQLAADIENLTQQLQTQRKLADDTAKQRYEDGKSIMKGEVEDLKKKLQSVEADVEKRVRREIELEFQAKSASSVAQIDAMKQEMGRREQDILARGASMKEAELRTKLDEMQSKNMELSEKHSSQLEELKKSDDKMVATLSELFSKALEGVNKKLSDIKLRALAGGGGGGAWRATSSTVPARRPWKAWSRASSRATSSPCRSRPRPPARSPARSTSSRPCAAAATRRKKRRRSSGILGLGMLGAGTRSGPDTFRRMHGDYPVR